VYLSYGDISVGWAVGSAKTFCIVLRRQLEARHMAFPANIDHKQNYRFAMKWCLYGSIQSTGTIGSVYRAAALVIKF